MDAYLNKYDGVRDYMKSIVEKAKQDGYVTTIYSRRRDLPELKSSNFNTRSFGERVALNMPIQGTAADIIKLAMVNVYNRLKAEGLKARLILQVHDELICECPENEAQTVADILQRGDERSCQAQRTAHGRCENRPQLGGGALMLTYEQAGDVLDDLVDELPEEIFKNLNGGVSFVEDAVRSDDGRYTLGMYFRDKWGGISSCITVRLQSFTETWTTRPSAGV